MILIIAAVAKNGIIGKNNDIPWYLPADFKYFTSVTRGHTVLMGQKTYESIIQKLGRPLPNRKNIVLTLDVKYEASGCQVINSWDEAIKISQNEDIFIIGGAQVYALALPHAKKLYLTVVDVNCEGDTSFPKYDESKWMLASSEPHQKDEKNIYNYTFNVYEKKK